MPVPLVYEISAIGEDKVKRAVRSIESELKATASRVETESRRAMGGARRGAADPVARQAARGFDQIGRAARAADAATIRARMAGERRAEAERISAIRRSAREEVRLGLKARKDLDAARERTARKMASGVASTVGGSVKKVVGLGASALALGGGLGGGIAATGAIEEEIAVRAAASRLANQAGKPQLKGQLAAESGNVKGFGRVETIEALGKFTDITGDLQAARDLIPELGKVALATSADLGDLAATAGNAFIPLKDQIADPVERLKAMKDVMAALAGQGAVGAVEIKDLATSFAGLAATSNRFSGNRADVLKAMGAITQAARQRGGAGDAAEAATSTERFSSDVIKHSAKLQAMGINVFSDKSHTQLADPKTIIENILKKTGGNLSALSDIFGERGIRAIQGFSPVYAEAERKKKGSGVQAVAEEFDRLMKAQRTNADMEAAAKSRLEDEDKKLIEVTKQFNSAIGKELLPVLTQAIPKFADLIPKLADLASGAAKLADWFLSNPLEGAITAFGAAVIADVAKQHIGELISSLLRGGTPGTPGTPLGGGPVGTALQLGALAGAGGYVLGGASADKLGKPTIDAATVRAQLAEGKLGGKDMLDARTRLQGNLSSLMQNEPSTLDTVFGGVSKVFGGKSAGDVHSEAMTTTTDTLEKLNVAIGKLGLDNKGDARAGLIAAANALKEAADVLKTSAPTAQPDTNPRRTMPIGAR